MTREEALHNFFSGFGVTAYPNTAVPDNALLPYLTYSVKTDDWWGGTVSLTVQLWWYTSSESLPNAKVQEIEAALSRGGKTLRCDCGMIWLKKGSPWCNALNGQDDNNMKVRQMNITAEYITI